jgi:hypothetical protein
MIQNGKWNIAVTLPGNVKGTLVWKDKKYSLDAGANKLTL